MSQAPRRINTDRSLNRPDQAAKAAPRPAAGTTGTSGRPAAGSTSGSGRSAPPRHSAQPARQVEPPRRRKKKKKTPLWLPFAVVMAVIAVVSGVVVYGVSMLNKVEDSLRRAAIFEEVKDRLHTSALGLYGGQQPRQRNAPGACTKYCDFCHGNSSPC